MLLPDCGFLTAALSRMDSNSPVCGAPARTIELVSYALAALALLLVLQLHLLPALLAGLLVNQLVQSIAPLLGRRLTGDGARVLIVAALGVLVVGLLILLILGVIGFFRDEIGDPGDLWQHKLMPLVEKARQQLPPSWVGWLPDSVDDLRVTVLELLRKHAQELQLAGKGVARSFVQIVIGLLLGAIVALSQARSAHRRGPLADALARRCRRLAGAFHRIVYAQIKISLVNTGFTALFLLGVLPLFSVHLPFSKTLVVATFVVGLLPVLGNLISNTAIAVAGLSVSLWVGAAALGFLILIHKLEYFLNARIVGTEIRARAWELLIAMLLMEAAFGLPGLIAAPIYYAYLKSELEARRLI
jgi:predicted PurR-regulated permease PerM